MDYWKDKDAQKYSLKNNFKSFHVTCLPAHGERSQIPTLALDVVTRGKKNLSELFRLVGSISTLLLPLPEFGMLGHNDPLLKSKDPDCYCIYEISFKDLDWTLVNFTLSCISYKESSIILAGRCLDPALNYKTLSH